MSDIKILPQTVVSKIAAGEVIERPASVIKELMENSIDAGATRIEVQLEDGGKKFIKVTDDGIGMKKEDVELAFLSHATSKLQTDDDLFSINTLGFRGEALPSIGSISQARIISRPGGASIGHEIQIEGSAIHKVKEKGAPEGTQVDVHNLFYNTPVRRKFLKSTQTEMAHITELATKLALAYPSIHFSIIHNGKNVLTFPKCEDTKERIMTIFGDERGKELIAINSEEPNVTVSGYVLPPTYNRPNTKMLYIFLNGRFIRDNAILHAINSAYRDLIMSKKSPIVFLFLKVNCKEVDVNVHPTKTEVRFKNAGPIHDQVYSTIRTALTRTEFHPSLKISHQNEEQTQEQTQEQAREQTQEHTKDHTEEEAVSRDNTGTFTDERKESIMNSMSDFFSKPIEKKRHYHEEKQKQTFFPPSMAGPVFKRERTSSSYLQIHNSYIVEETADGVNIIDQHALHEIILYHEIWEQLKSSRLLTQNMLIPEMIELSPRDFHSIMGLKTQLDKLGLEIEEFGKSTITIRKHPQVLKKLDFRGLIQDLLDEIESDEIQSDPDNILRKIAKIMACKGAVKSGQKLTSQEIDALLAKRKESSITAFCPHGRPTTLEFKISELEKQFKRK